MTETYPPPFSSTAEALLEGIERYRQVTEITEEAWWDEYLQTGQLRNSRQFCKMLGCGEEMLECSISAHRKLIHPDDRGRVEASLDRACLEGAAFRETYRLRHARGHYIWVDDHGRVVTRDAGGHPIRMIGIITDITARKEAEIALQESEENFRHLFDDAPDAYLIMDPETLLILHCNHATERMLRGNLEQIVNMGPEDISPPFQPDGRRSAELVPEIRRQVFAQRYQRFEWVHRRLDGTDFWVEVTATLGTYKKRTVRFVSWREIGEIITAKQAAEAANVAKSQFLSVMSHELRTPLTSIIGMLHLIKIAGVNEKAQEYATRGMKNSEHLLKLVDDILDFSSIESGRLTVVREPFRLRTLLEEVSHAAAGARPAGVSVMVDAEDSLRDLEFAGDALRLKQVLINLLGNALKFTERGGVVLAVKRAGGTANTPVLEFAVDDTGVGLTPEQKERLFHAFTQADMSDARRFGGPGLGLVISQRLVGLMGGEPIAVESQVGVGSRFSFQLPLPLAEAAAAPTAVPASAAPALPGGPLAGLRVLLVDDSEPIRFALGLILQSEGASVEVAVDGAEGVKMALTAVTPHDVVLMDLQMPVQNGIEATRELRLRDYTQPIVALTASAFSRDRQACLAAGMNDYIAKPVRVNELVDILLRNSRRSGA